MSTTINTGWLKDNNGDKFAPKTLSSQIITNEGTLFEDEIQEKIDNIDGGIEITKAEYDALGDSVLTDGKTYFIKDINGEGGGSGSGSNIAVDIIYDNTESGLESNNIQDAIDELATSVKGIVIDVTTDSWDLQEDGTYKKVIAIEGLTGNEVLNVCLDPSYEHTEEQITAFSELVTSIETAEGRIILTASEAITVEFRILLYGKIGFDVCSGNGGSSNGGGNTTSIDLTQAEYDALVESGEVEPDVNYYITDAVNEEVSNKTVSDIFVSTKDYVAGDYCIYGNTLYKFIADKSAGDWNESVVKATSVGDEINEVNSKIDEQNENIDNIIKSKVVALNTNADGTCAIPKIDDLVYPLFAFTHYKYSDRGVKLQIYQTNDNWYIYASTINENVNNAAFDIRLIYI